MFRAIHQTGGKRLINQINVFLPSSELLLGSKHHLYTLTDRYTNPPANLFIDKYSVCIDST